MLKRLFKDIKGVAAVEFGLIAPIMSAGVLLLADVASIVHTKMELNSALRSGTQYTMAGGDSANAMESVIKNSTTLDLGTSVAVWQHCECNGAPEVAVVCTLPCEDGSATLIFTRVTASAPAGMFLYKPTLSTTLGVRTR